MKLNQYTGWAVQMALKAVPLTSTLITSRLLPVTSIPCAVHSKAHYWNFEDRSRVVQEQTGFEIINRKRNTRKLPLETKTKEWTHYTSVHLTGTQPPSRPFRCTTLDYSLLLHVSAIGYGHLQGTTNFIDVYSLYCKYVNGKSVNFYPLYMKFVIPEDGHIMWPKHVAALDKSVQRILSKTLCGTTRPLQYIPVVRKP
jgi:hypothetical protein